MVAVFPSIMLARAWRNRSAWILLFAARVLRSMMRPVDLRTILARWIITLSAKAGWRASVLMKRSGGRKATWCRSGP